MPDSKKSFNFSLINLEPDYDISATNLAQNNTDYLTRNAQTRTTCSRFSPLPSPIISEKFELASLVSTPSYVPSHYRYQSRQHDNYEKTDKRSHTGDAHSSGGNTPQQQTSDPVSFEPEPPTAFNQKLNSKQTSQSGHRHQHLSRPSSQVAFERHSSVGNSVKNSHSPCPSANQSTTHSHIAKSSVNPLTEVALKLHSVNIQSQLLSDCGLARSQALPPGALSDCGSPKSHWLCGEPKDAELENLMELEAQHEAKRREELLQRQNETEKYLTEQDENFDALSSMVHERQEKRQRDLGNLTGTIIDPHVASQSPHSSPLFCLPNLARSPALLFSPSHLHSSHASKTPSRALSLMKHIEETLNEGPVPTIVRGESLVKNLRAASHAPSATHSTKTSSIPREIAHSYHEPNNIPGETAQPNFKSTSKAASVISTAHITSRQGMAMVEPIVNTPMAEALCKLGRSRAPSVQADASSQRPPAASNSLQSSSKASNNMHPESVHDQPLEDDNQSQSVAKNIHPAPIAVSLDNESVSHVPTNTGSDKASANGASPPTSTHAKITQAPSDGRRSRAPSNNQGSHAPSIAKVSRAPSIAPSARSILNPTNAQAPTEVGKTRSQTNEGASPQSEGAGSPQAPSHPPSRQAPSQSSHLGAQSNYTGGPPLPDKAPSDQASVHTQRSQALLSYKSSPPSRNDLDVQAALNAADANSQAEAAGSQTPKSVAKSHAPTVASRNQAPSVASGSRAPSVAVKSQVPSVASRSRAPTVAVKSHAPTVASRNQGLSVASRSRAPSVASRSKAPSVTSRNQAPSVTSGNQPLIVPPSMLPPSQGGVEAQSNPAPSVVSSHKAPTVPPSNPPPPESRAEQQTNPESVASAQSHQNPSQAGGDIHPAIDDVETQLRISERPESINPPSSLGEEGGNAEENVVDGNDEGAPVEDPTLERPDSPLGSKAGEIIGEEEICPDPINHIEDDGRQVYPGLTQPLGKWIRFGRAGFRFHIFSHSDIYCSPIPE